MTREFPFVALPIFEPAGASSASGNAPESVLRPVTKPTLGKAFFALQLWQRGCTELVGIFHPYRAGADKGSLAGREPFRDDQESRR
jgi:hypothetical protein